MLRPRKPRAPFSEDIAVRVLDGLCAGRGLRQICRDPHMPSRSTVQDWAQRHADVAHLLDLGHDNARLTRAEAIFEAIGGWAYFRPVTPEEAAEFGQSPKGRRPRRRPSLDDDLARRPPLPVKTGPCPLLIRG